MCKVSILIAAYNVEEYIAETLSSAVAQTLKDIEIVVVDDCSTDGTSEILSKYAELDSRIKIIRHEENSGLVRVRQTGLKNSCGEYIIFLDGDDTLTPDACEKAYNAIVSEKVDLLEFGFELFFTSAVSDTEELERDFREAVTSLTHKAVSVSKAGLLDLKATGGVINFTIWDKIYKRSLLEAAGRFVPDEYMNMAEDVLYSFLIQHHARSYSYIPDRLYIYRFGSGMSTTPTLSRRLMSSLAKMAMVYDYLSGLVKDWGTEKECRKALARVHQKTYGSIAGIYTYRVQKDERDFYISEVLKYGNAGDLIVGFSNHIYDRLYTPDRIATKCAALDMFTAKKTKAETIGVYYFRVYNGGIENVISSLTDIWVKAGYRVVLFTDEEPCKDDYYINPAVKRVVVPKMEERDYFNRKERVEVFRKVLIENGVDVMVYNAWISPDLLLDEMIIKSCGVNLVIHTHGLFCCELGHAEGEIAHYCSTLPKLYSLADSVVALTDVDAAWWQAMGVRCFKTVNPIQLDMDTETASLDGNELLFVGRISGEKQVIDAIKIAELVREEIPDARLTVVGKGDDANYIKAVDDYIKEHELQELVNMAGFSTDVLSFYRASDVVLSTSKFEGFGLALMESKLCGVPLVCYELPNLDITRDPKGMIVVDQQDVSAAAKAVVRILKDAEYKKRLGREARESAEEFYRVDFAERWRGFFEETLQPKPPRVPIYRLSATEAAMRIAVEHYGEGIVDRTRREKEALARANDDSRQRCEELEKELAQFRRAESYRIGMIVTFIPRLIKRLIKKLFGRGGKTGRNAKNG